MAGSAMNGRDTAGGMREGGPRWQGMGPVFLSAVVFPGVGQWMQRRWVAGSAYAVVFGVAFGWLIVRCLKVLKAYYDLAFDFNHATGEAPSLVAIVIPFVLSMAIYLVNLVDTAIAGRRRRDAPPLPPQP